MDVRYLTEEELESSDFEKCGNPFGVRMTAWTKDEYSKKAIDCLGTLVERTAQGVDRAVIGFGIDEVALVDATASIGPSTWDYKVQLYKKSNPSS
ncbi:MAG: hypothetical protein JSW08_01745 [archaeon]|nr:MAG: hypothetical protein JSW08_01745 [archaeon]